MPGFCELLAWLLFWFNEGFPDLKLGVNISVVQFREGEELIALVENILQESGLPAQNLELEVTESTMVGDFDLALTTLTRLQEMGVIISLDDFGTGYSSLAVLKRLPIHTLKIDRSFVSNLEEDPHGVAFISAITSIAKQLDLHVIAEGVENYAQLEIIRDNGGDEIQGFYFCPPIGTAAFLGLLQGAIPLGGVDWHV